MPAVATRRTLLKAGGALIVALGLMDRAFAQRPPAADAALGKTLDTTELDGFLAIHADGSVTLFCGKVALGTGFRQATPQLAGRQHGICRVCVARVEGDPQPTPGQLPHRGRT